MRDPINVLNSLSDKSKDPSYKFERLYRNLYNPEFYKLAYMNIYANDGSMTPGTSGVTMDGMSESRIDRLIESLRNHSYRPNPARRVYIEKKNSTKKRPLGIISGDDKLVQEIVRMILESIYEPSFSKASHGFRPSKSCHTALKQIQTVFTGANWFVEGDITACYDSFDHHVLIGLLRKRINDEAFIALMWKFLKAGYMDQWTYHKNYSGVPQGSGVSPVLANIYLSELDRFMEEYKDGFKREDRKNNPEYHKLSDKIQHFKTKNAKVWDRLDDRSRKERAKELRKMRTKLVKIPRRPFREETFKGLQYVRYADDFIIGVIGSKEDAEKIKNDIANFLKDDLRLTLSMEKTKITHSAERSRFLGYDLTVGRSNETKRNKNGIRQRVYNGVVRLYVPHDKWKAKLLDCGAIRIKTDNGTGKETWKALHRGKLCNLSRLEILYRVNSEVRGFYNYYSIACNASSLHGFSDLMKWSMIKTFAAKFKCSTREIKKQHVRNGVFTVVEDTGKSTKEATYYNKGFRKKTKPLLGQVDVIDVHKRYARPNSLAARIRARTCELCCAKGVNIEMHQVKRLKDLTGWSEWEVIMRRLRRKTLAVCHECHRKIHENDEFAS